MAIPVSIPDLRYATTDNSLPSQLTPAYGSFPSSTPSRTA